MTDHTNRPAKDFCFRCGGSYMTLGMQSRYVPHEDLCPRNPHRKPQSIAEQDRERAALTVDPLDSPWSDQHKRQTYFRSRSRWEQDVDIEGGAA